MYRLKFKYDGKLKILKLREKIFHSKNTILNSLKFMIKFRYRTTGNFNMFIEFIERSHKLIFLKLFKFVNWSIMFNNNENILTKFVENISIQI